MTTKGEMMTDEADAMLGRIARRLYGDGDQDGEGGLFKLGGIFAIDPDKVTAVLLPDGWWDVEPLSFSQDQWEVCSSCAWDEEPTHPVPPERFPQGFTFVGVPVSARQHVDEERAYQRASGRAVVEYGQRVTGPWSSLLAIRHGT